ncbi:MAG: bile acid:sodium symporter family protein, partial [Saprospiraceae bacterium]|nr:bile acid:sodium symporter family protein [Saprospiraceae bacterium]
MNEIDSITINFNDNQIILLNICLGVLMFGVALDLKISDFIYVIKNPKSVIAGLISQLILLPLLTIALVWVLKPEYSVAMGMILIASCPGGNVSNYAVHLSGANSALSVILTMISTLFCALSTPFIFEQLSTLIPYDNGGSTIFNINFGDMVLTIGQLILIPLIIGIL